MACSPKCILKRRIRWLSGKERWAEGGRREGGEGRVYTGARQPLRAHCHANAISRIPCWRDPSNRDRKKTLYLAVARRKKAAQGPRGWANSQYRWDGLARELTPPPHPPVPLLPLTGSEDKGSKAARSLLCSEALAADFWGGREESTSFILRSTRLPSDDLPCYSAGRSGNEARFKSLWGLLSLGQVRLTLIASQKRLSVSRMLSATECVLLSHEGSVPREATDGNWALYGTTLKGTKLGLSGKTGPAGA